MDSENGRTLAGFAAGVWQMVKCPQTIHALGSYFSKGRLMREMKVLVSDLSLQRSSGNTMLNELQTAIEYK